MERRISSVAVVCVVLGILMGAQNSMADFQSCYKSCFILCAITPGETIPKCSFKCLKDCIIPSTTDSLPVNPTYSCMLGCSTSRCTHISTQTYPGEKEVSGCVDSCSGVCSNN